MKTGCFDVANNLVSQHRVSTSTSFFDIAQASYAEQMKHQGDPSGINYFKTHSLDRIPLEFAGQFSWHCAADAVALAAIHPLIFRAMFEHTYALVSKEQWEFAASAGLDIGKEQPRKDYESAERAENTAFLEYCRQSRPDLYQILVG